MSREVGEIITHFVVMCNDESSIVKKNGVTDDVITCDNTEYYSHTLAEVVDEKMGMIES